MWSASFSYAQTHAHTHPLSGSIFHFLVLVKWNVKGKSAKYFHRLVQVVVNFDSMLRTAVERSSNSSRRRLNENGVVGKTVRNEALPKADESASTGKIYATLQSSDGYKVTPFCVIKRFNFSYFISS